MSLFGLITESVICEVDANLAYNKFYNTMPREDFDEIIGGEQNVDKFTQFFLNAVKDGNAVEKDAIDILNQYRNSDPNIKQKILTMFRNGEIESIYDIEDNLNIITKTGIYSYKDFQKEGFHNIYHKETDDMVVNVTCTTNYAANQHYFGHTPWCTASDRNGRYDGFDMFRRYTLRNVNDPAALFQIKTVSKTSTYADGTPETHEYQLQVYDGHIVGEINDEEHRGLSIERLGGLVGKDVIGKIHEVAKQMIDNTKTIGEREMQYQELITRRGNRIKEKIRQIILDKVNEAKEKCIKYNKWIIQENKNAAAQLNLDKSYFTGELIKKIWGSVNEQSIYEDVLTDKDAFADVNYLYWHKEFCLDKTISKDEQSVIDSTSLGCIYYMGKPYMTIDLYDSNGHYILDEIKTIAQASSAKIKFGFTYNTNSQDFLNDNPTKYSVMFCTVKEIYSTGDVEILNITDFNKDSDCFTIFSTRAKPRGCNMPHLIRGYNGKDYVCVSSNYEYCKLIELKKKYDYDRYFLLNDNLILYDTELSNNDENGTISNTVFINVKQGTVISEKEAVLRFNQEVLSYKTEQNYIILFDYNAKHTGCRGYNFGADCPDFLRYVSYKRVDVEILEWSKNGLSNFTIESIGENGLSVSPTEFLLPYYMSMDMIDICLNHLEIGYHPDPYSYDGAIGDYIWITWDNGQIKYWICDSKGNEKREVTKEEAFRKYINATKNTKNWQPSEQEKADMERAFGDYRSANSRSTEAHRQQIFRDWDDADNREPWQEPEENGWDVNDEIPAFANESKSVKNMRRLMNKINELDD